MSKAHHNQRFLVSGAASGIGLAISRMALLRNARVCLLDRDEAALLAVCRELGDGAFPIVCDVADPVAVNLAVARAVEWLGGLDALVNSVGIDAYSPLDQLSDVSWERTLAVNLTGPMMLCRAALPHLRSAGGGTIVNVASAAGLSPLKHRTAYCAAKAGVIMFGKALAIEAAPDRIRVNAVCPGAVDTPLFRSSYEGSDDPERDLEAIRQRYAMQRIADPMELAEAVLYLSGPGSTYITGTALAVDGGRTFH